MALSCLHAVKAGLALGGGKGFHGNRTISLERDGVQRAGSPRVTSNKRMRIRTPKGSSCWPCQGGKCQQSQVQDSVGVGTVCDLAAF